MVQKFEAKSPGHIGRYRDGVLEELLSARMVGPLIPPARHRMKMIERKADIPTLGSEDSPSIAQGNARNGVLPPPLSRYMDHVPQGKPVLHPSFGLDPFIEA